MSEAERAVYKEKDAAPAAKTVESQPSACYLAAMPSIRERPSRGADLFNAWMQKRGLSPRAAGELVGASRCAVRGWMDGRATPTIEHAHQIQAHGGPPVTAWTLKKG